YSALATKLTLRGSISGRKVESAIDRWLEARIAGPVAGTCSAPSMRGRHSRRRNGPVTIFVSWYSTVSPHLGRRANPNVVPGGARGLRRARGTHPRSEVPPATSVTGGTTLGADVAVASS